MWTQQKYLSLNNLELAHHPSPLHPHWDCWISSLHWLVLLSQPLSFLMPLQSHFCSKDVIESLTRIGEITISPLTLQSSKSTVFHFCFSVLPSPFPPPGHMAPLTKRVVVLLLQQWGFSQVPCMASPWLRKKSIPRIPFLCSHSFTPPHPTLLLPSPPLSTPPLCSLPALPLLSLSTGSPTAMDSYLHKTSSQVLSSRKLSCLLDSRPIILRICWTSLFMSCWHGSTVFKTKTILFSKPTQPSAFFIFVNSANITLVMQTKNIWLFALPHPIYLTHFLCLTVSWLVSWPLSLLSVAIVITQIYMCQDSCNSLLNGCVLDFVFLSMFLTFINLPEAHF